MKLQLRLWEWAVILVLVFIGAALLMAALPRAREASRHASCASNLKQLGMVMKMFANESKGATFPPLSPIPNNWMFDMSALYPEYLTDLSVLVCPSSLIHLRFERPECVSSLYYIYTGYAIVSDEQALALFEAYHYLPFAAFARNDLALPVRCGQTRAARTHRRPEHHSRDVGPHPPQRVPVRAPCHTAPTYCIWTGTSSSSSTRITTTPTTSR